MTRDPRIDAKIADAPAFAQPILSHLRELIHSLHPEIEEAIKWNMPHFVYRGKNVAGLAAFKAHCAIAIHGDAPPSDASGQYIKLASLEDLPPDGQLEKKLRATLAQIDAKIDSGKPGKGASEPPPGN